MLDLFLLMFQNVKKKKLWNLKLRTNLGLAEENAEGEIFSLPFIYEVIFFLQSSVTLGKFSKTDLTLNLIITDYS